MGKDDLVRSDVGDGVALAIGCSEALTGASGVGSAAGFTT